MVYTSPAVVIDNGSYTTRAGFALEDIPSLVFSSNYAVSNGNTIVGDDNINNHADAEIMTLMDNGLIYNFDNIVHNWQYVYDNIDNNNRIDSKEFPLVLTEQLWNTSKNKLTTAQIVFETLEVPIFSLVKSPLAQLYRAGKSTGLVIDVGLSVASVTPILDGIIQNKSSFHSKYAGDFLNVHVLEYLRQKTGVDTLVPQQFASASPSFQHWYVSHNVLHDYKLLALSYQLLDYQLPNGGHVAVADAPNFLANVFQPNLNPVPGITVPEPAVDKPHTHGLTNLVFLALKSLESVLLPHANDTHAHNKFARFNETFKLLLLNILVTGGLALAPNLGDQLLNDLRVLTPKYFPNYAYSPYTTTTVAPADSNDWEKNYRAWMGACNLALMLNDASDDSNSVNIALDNWFVTKADYEELGEDLILEKFK